MSDWADEIAEPLGCSGWEPSFTRPSEIAAALRAADAQGFTRGKADGLREAATMVEAQMDIWSNKATEALHTQNKARLERMEAYQSAGEWMTYSFVAAADKLSPPTPPQEPT